MIFVIRSLAKARICGEIELLYFGLASQVYKSVLKHLLDTSITLEVKRISRKNRVTRGAFIRRATIRLLACNALHTTPVKVYIFLTIIKDIACT